MAAPIAAGVAGLVRTVFPEYTAMQTYHQLRSTLAPLTGNNKKQYGRLEAFNAVSFNNPAYPGKVCPGVSISS